MRYLSCSTLMMLLALGPRRSLQKDPEISITPRRSVINGTVNFVCRNYKKDRKNVNFLLIHEVTSATENVAELKTVCESHDKGSKKKKETKFKLQSYKPGYTKPTPSKCHSMTVSGVIATRAIAGKYRCDIVFITSRGRYIRTDKTQSAELTVGDPTPAVSRIELADAATAVRIGDRVAAGTNVSLTCETGPADPAPKFTVSWKDGAELPRASVGADPFITYVRVPKVPSIAFTCSVYNGFGDRRVANIEATVEYPAELSAISTPSTAELQTEKEFEICSVANNPPKQLTISGLDASLVQASYPRFEQRNGFSRAFVKLAETATTAKELAYICGVDGINKPVKIPLAGVEGVTTQESRTIASTTASYNISNAGSAQVSTPSSAMMTIGIVIAVVVVFVLAVAGIAYALKKRSAAAKASNGENAGYGKVNQNDADRGAPRKLDDMPSTAV